MTETTSQQGNVYSNTDYLNSNIIQLRLQTDQLLQQLNDYLKGEYKGYKKLDDGTYTEVLIKKGKALANDEGVQAICGYMSGVINSSVVQGNFTESHYYCYVDRIHESLTRILVINYNEWSICQENLELIIDYIMNLVEPFISRLVKNLERESYAQTIRSVEQNTISGRGFNIFGGGVKQ